MFKTTIRLDGNTACGSSLILMFRYAVKRTIALLSKLFKII